MGALKMMGGFLGHSLQKCTVCCTSVEREEELAGTGEATVLQQWQSVTNCCF